MTISVTKYINATKGFPLLFENVIEDNNDTESIEEAVLYPTKEIAVNELSRWDEPSSRQIIPVKITYQI